MFKRGIVASLLTLTVGAACADTVTFKNNDHLTGTIDEINDTTVVFTSPALGRLTLPRDTIKTLQSEKPVTVQRPTATGPAPRRLYITPDGSGTGWQESENPPATPTPAVAQVAAPSAPVDDPKKIPGRFTPYLYLGPAWKNELALGYSGRSGNEESTDLSASLRMTYDKEPHELNLGLEGLYASQEGKQTQGLFRQTAVYRYNFNPRWFWFVDDEMRYDGIKGISTALTAASGPGYYFFRGPKFKMDLRAGPGIFYQRRFDGDESLAPSAEVGLRISYKINTRLDLTHETTYNVSLTDNKDFTIKSETAANFKLDIERGIGIKAAFQDEYDGQPSEGRESNDSRLIVALTLSF